MCHILSVLRHTHVGLNLGWIAGATLMPSTLSLLRNLFHDPKQLRLAIAVWTSGFMIGGALGPVVGGFMLQVTWWGAVFLLAVPVMALLLAVGHRLLPETERGDVGPVDLNSAVLATVAIIAGVFALKHAVEYGVGVRSLVSFVAGVLLAAIFLRRQRRLPTPFLDVSLFSRPVFVVGVGAMTFNTVVMIGMNLYIAQHLQLVHGLDPFVAGLWLLPMTLGMLLGVGLTPLLAHRCPEGPIIAGGFALSAVAYGWMALTADDPSIHAFVAASAVAAIGLGPAGALGTTIVVSAAPPPRAAAASAISETSNELGGALGLAILGSIGTAVYRTTVADALPARPPDVATAAQESIGGALAAGQRLASTAENGVASAAGTAFAQAVAVTASVSAVLLVLASIWVLTAMRGKRYT